MNFYMRLIQLFPFNVLFNGGQGIVPPFQDEFLLLDGSDFLLLDGSTFLLL